jgi:hypothetical protein
MRPAGGLSIVPALLGWLALAGCQAGGAAHTPLIKCPAPKPAIAASPAPKEKSEREPARLCRAPA